MTKNTPHATTNPIDQVWTFHREATALLAPTIVDECQRVVLELACSDFDVDARRAIAVHLVAVHNGWIERQRHLDRATLSNVPSTANTKGQPR